MSNIDAVTKLIQNNSKDVMDVVNRIGIGNLIAMTPALLRIMNTVSSAKDADAVADKVEMALYYSDATKEKVKAFQQKNGLHADGLVGDRTWGKVEELLKEKGK